MVKTNKSGSLNGTEFADKSGRVNTALSGPKHQGDSIGARGVQIVLLDHGLAKPHFPVGSEA